MAEKNLSAIIQYDVAEKNLALPSQNAEKYDKCQDVSIQHVVNTRDVVMTWQRKMLGINTIHGPLPMKLFSRSKNVLIFSKRDIIALE